MVCLLNIVSVSVFADQTSSDYQSDQSIIQKNTGAIGNTVNHFDPRTTFDRYSPNPKEISDFSKGSGTNFHQRGLSNLASDKAGSTVYQNFNNPDVHMKINPDAPEFQDSQLVQSDSYNVTHGISDQNIDCQKHKRCHIESEAHQCIKDNSILLKCTKTPKVTISDSTYEATVDYQGAIPSHSWKSHDVFSLPEDGVLEDVSIQLHAEAAGFACGGNVSEFFEGVLHGRLHFDRCGSIHDPIILMFHNSNLNLSIKANQMLSVDLSSTGLYVKAYLKYDAHLKVIRHKKISSVIWSTDCPVGESL